MDKHSTDFEERENALPNEAPEPLNAKFLRIFAKMVTEHHHRLQRYVRTLCRDEALCNDLVQETFLAAQQQMERGVYSETGRGWYWLCAIAKNLLVDYYRHYNRCNMQLFLNHTQICDNLGWSSESSSEGSCDPAMLTMFGTDTSSSYEKRRKRISNNMGVLMQTQFKALSLSEEERELLCQRYCDEQVFREVSARTGEPISTVMSRYYAALKKVRKQLMALDAQGLFAKELSLAQMRAYIRSKNSAAASDTQEKRRVQEARQRDRMRKIAAYARRNRRRDDDSECVPETVR
ncbi:MAG: RNA polymerase sigma factor [Bacteroidales bacterium]|nr:RNA polymerase sigma factor [Bacteroidales bacterium]